MIKYIKWTLLVVVFGGVGIFLMIRLGGSLIREVTQEVVIGRESGGPLEVGIGEKAPYWELSDVDGNQITLSEFLDVPLVLTFWASWNSMSTDQLKIFDDYLASHNSVFFQIAAINNQEGRGAVLNFMRRGGYEVQVLVDDTGAVGEAYRVQTLPMTYFIDSDGFVRDVFHGVLNADMFEERVEKLIR